ncbi:MAG: fatty acid desaturase [Anaerolineaceae bacterium]|nr:fatty acid desaturase [Anaerolineaceae bacterium]
MASIFHSLLKDDPGVSCGGVGDLARPVDPYAERPRPLAMRPNPGEPVNWYRTPLPRETLAELNRRSDFRGAAQTLGFLGLLLLSGGATWYSSQHFPWPLTLLLLFVHGSFYGFTINAVHELSHRSVFRTKLLNDFFVYVFGFLGMHSVVYFRYSHLLHHLYTLHPPDDLEVVLPLEYDFRCFLKTAFVNPRGVRFKVQGLLRWCRGRFAEGYESEVLFPETEAKRRQAVIRETRLYVAGHLLLALVSLLTGHWILILLVTLGTFYGSWLLFLLNNTQHVGLRDNVPDFRLCTRTFYVNPFLRFLYWHMNYHIEHHMYAAVPCYNLRKLHEAIRHDIPPVSDGLVATWREIIAIMRRQHEDPTWQHRVTLPVGANPPREFQPRPDRIAEPVPA